MDREAWHVAVHGVAKSQKQNYKIEKNNGERCMNHPLVYTYKDTYFVMGIWRGE